MKSVEEALALVLDHSFSLEETELLPLEQCLNKCLAKAVQAPIDLPSYRQSSMDGYAMSLGDSHTYTLVGEIKAGDSANPKLNPGECVRIFTGAVVPDTANAVVMQEKTVAKGTIVEVRTPINKGQNIRAVGSQVQKGDLPLEKGQILQASGLAFLQSLGICELEVIRTPKVTLILTGNELISPSEKLSRGKIYESNSVLLKAALEQQGITPNLVSFSEDTLEATVHSLKEAFFTSDLVLVSGGISVGDYDFVKKALALLEVEELFYKVRQRPGKPLFFGKKEKSFVFALPGNPASTLSCFYVYVLPLLARLKGSQSEGLVRVAVPLAHDFSSEEPRALFLKASVTDKSVSILDRQNSSMLVSFAKANALVYIPENGASLKKGALVEVLLLPNTVLT
jgi:molybdopterin molybdotransferase